MSKLEDTSVQDIEAAIGSGQMVRSQQIIHLAIGLGPVLFAGVIGFLYSTSEAPSEAGDPQMLNILSIGHVAVALGCWMASFVIPNVMLSPKRLADVMSKPMRLGGGRYGPPKTLDDPAEIFLALTTQAHVLRLAMLEGPALFGLVICLIGTVDGQLRTQPIFWLNGLSTVVLVLWVAVTFPSKDKLVELFRSKKEDASVAF